MSFRYQLSRPLAYWSVEAPSIPFYRLWGPAGLTLVISVLLLVLPVGIDIVGDRSLVSFLSQLFAILPGFYIASLAAVVAFQGGDLDKEMPDATASITANGDTSDVEITLRVFLCYLFAYLTVLAFVGFFTCMAGVLAAPSFNMILADSEVANWVRPLLASIYVAFLIFITASLVLCTIQGLYFLAERVHQTLVE